MKIKNLDEFLKDGELRTLVNQEVFILQVTEAIIGYMADHSISRTQLAEKMGKSKAQITQLLSGSRNMTLRSLADIALALGIEIGFHIEEACNSKIAPAVPKTPLNQGKFSKLLHWRERNELKVRERKKIEIDKYQESSCLPLAANG